ncbi:MAG: flippase-like domain-containing protein [Actinobacteria bacterium]|nr:MAG: flippase-like domain-containing protein [Actinomycetota bacterium]
MPAELNPRRIRRRLVQIALVVAVIAIVVLVGPGLGSLRSQLAHASPGWVVAGVGFEVLSALAYVVIFRAVFCPRMTWRLSYQIGMAEQAANSVLSVSGAGGLALGAWALHRGGMNTEHIARRTVAFFFLTSMANVGAVIVLALLYAVGILQNNRNPALTYAFGAAAAVATAIVVALPAVLTHGPAEQWQAQPGSKLAAALHYVRFSLGQGIRDGLLLLRRRSVGVLVGSVGTMVFDVAVLGMACKAVGYSPAPGMLALGYLIGQLGGNIPVPGGIGGLDGGLIGTFVLYHQPLAPTTAAVLIYHAIVLWIPALLGSVAFVQLRNTLRREARPAAMCAPLAEPIEVARPAAVAQ